jgi:8-oxo-dGTP diphosphatase
VIEVAAAVIQRPDGSFLLARRPAGKVYAGYWEFPGGKIEAGEDPARALFRELHEELGIGVERSYPWIAREYLYPHGHVRLQFFRVVQWKGEPHPREDQAIAWQRPGAAEVRPMLPANAPVLAALELPHEYAITDSRRFGLPAIERRLKAGLRLLQVREPELPQAERERFTQQAIELAHRHGCKLMTKSPFPGADGVHYSAAELAKLNQRPRDMLAAASCHARPELERAMNLGLDFAVLGPVKDKAAIGWDGFARIVAGTSIPVYAIGGLQRSDLEDAWRAGAHGVAMIRGAWS